MDRLDKELAAAGVTYKVIGVEDLAQVDATGYTVVVVINTCLAWGLDYDVQTFLDRQKRHKNIIVLTTSGDGGWLPDKAERDFDALSAASKMTSVDAVARDIMERIHARLGRMNP